MSGYHRRHHHSHKPQPRGGQPFAGGSAGTRAASSAEIAGAGAMGAAPLVGERVGQWTEEVLGRVPSPMLAGLAVGALVGVPLGYLLRERHATGGHADRIAVEQDREKPPAR